MIDAHTTTAPNGGVFELAPARPPDFDAVATLFEALHRYNAALDSCFALATNWRALLYQRFMETHADPQMLWLLARYHGQPVGLLIVKAHVDSALFQHRNWTELVAIYVEPAHRGQQLAAHLVEQARIWTTAQGLNRLQLYVTASNAQARAFYRRCGLYPVQEVWRLDVQPDQAASAAWVHDTPTHSHPEWPDDHHHYFGSDTQGE